MKRGADSHDRSRSHDYSVLSYLVEKVKDELPKLIMLKKLISDQLSLNPSSRMIVFTQYRDTAKHIVEALKEVPGVRAERFVGQAKKANDRGMSQEEQARMIKALEQGEINVIGFHFDSRRRA